MFESSVSERQPLNKENIKRCTQVENIDLIHNHKNLVHRQLQHRHLSTNNLSDSLFDQSSNNLYIDDTLEPYDYGNRGHMTQYAVSENTNPTLISCLHTDDDDLTGLRCGEGPRENIRNGFYSERKSVRPWADDNSERESIRPWADDNSERKSVRPWADDNSERKSVRPWADDNSERKSVRPWADDNSERKSVRPWADDNSERKSVRPWADDNSERKSVRPWADDNSERKSVRPWADDNSERKSVRPWADDNSERKSVRPWADDNSERESIRPWADDDKATDRGIMHRNIFSNQALVGSLKSDNKVIANDIGNRTLRTSHLSTPLLKSKLFSDRQTDDNFKPTCNEVSGKTNQGFEDHNTERFNWSLQSCCATSRLKQTLKNENRSPFIRNFISAGSRMLCNEHGGNGQCINSLIGCSEKSNREGEKLKLRNSRVRIETADEDNINGIYSSYSNDSNECISSHVGRKYLPLECISPSETLNGRWHILSSDWLREKSNVNNYRRQLENPDMMTHSSAIDHDDYTIPIYPTYKKMSISHDDPFITKNRNYFEGCSVDGRFSNTGTMTGHAYNYYLSDDNLHKDHYVRRRSENGTMSDYDSIAQLLKEKRSLDNRLAERNSLIPQDKRALVDHSVKGSQYNIDSKHSEKPDYFPGSLQMSLSGNNSKQDVKKHTGDQRNKAWPVMVRHEAAQIMQDTHGHRLPSQCMSPEHQRYVDTSTEEFSPNLSKSPCNRSLHPNSEDMSIQKNMHHLVRDGCQCMNYSCQHNPFGHQNLLKNNTNRKNSNKLLSFKIDESNADFINKNISLPDTPKVMSAPVSSRFDCERNKHYLKACPYNPESKSSFSNIYSKSIESLNKSTSSKLFL